MNENSFLVPQDYSNETSLPSVIVGPYCRMKFHSEENDHFMENIILHN